LHRELRSLQRDWEDLATLDPYWAVLTHPEEKHDNWDRNAFFDSGRQDVARILAKAQNLGLPVHRRRALDFGCGLGRTTRALAPWFSAVCGVDVSPKLVAEATSLNRDAANCSFEVNAAEDLARFESGAFDLVHSILVLQHLPSTALIRRYIAEFVRVTDPSGLVVFQVPERVPLLRRIQPRRRAYGVLRRLGVPPEALYRRLRLDPMQVRALSGPEVTAALETAGATLLAIEPDDLAGAFPSVTYYASLRQA
jgi:SAM-dependent methyltransferase